MPARPRRRGTGRKLPSTIRKMDKQIRKRSRTPPPPRISTLMQHSPRRRSHSPRRVREPVPRSPFKSSPKKDVVHKPLRRNSSPPPMRPREMQKSREETPDKNYSHNAPFEDHSKEHQTVYSLEDLKSIHLQIQGYKKMRDVYPGKKSDKNLDIIRTFNPDNFILPRQQGEGSTPIFEGLPIRKNDDYDLELPHPDRLSYGPSSSFNDNIRNRDYYPTKGKERTIINTRRPMKEEYDEYKVERTRADESRYHQEINIRRSRSFDRLRDVTMERRDRYEERSIPRGSRRSLDRERERERDREERERERIRERERDRERMRGRSDERLVTRRPSPPPRRHVDHFREVESRRRSLDRRSRSLERSSLVPESIRSGEDHPSNHSLKSRGYDGPDETAGPSSRGRGSSFYSRGRGGGMAARAFIRPLPPVVFRGMPMGRGPVGRRLPFPPRKSFRGPLHGRH